MSFSHDGEGGPEEAGDQGAERGGFQWNGELGWSGETVVSQSLLDGVPGAGFFSRVGETESEAVSQEEKVKSQTLHSPSEPHSHRAADAAQVPQNAEKTSPCYN